VRIWLRALDDFIRVHLRSFAVQDGFSFALKTLTERSMFRFSNCPFFNLR